ncbi:Prefoldin subunit 2 [Toxocara canis]|uniref:Prefoldin subunit 2 n=1 Tax=Toxocara canis TaxID=6265 RepID=A0A0B2UTR2_TOXCA|nr:Prefoldin subunit 2 [Toxocara canis]
MNEQQEVVEHFQKLREQQQDIANEIAKVNDERREHKRVTEMLKKMPNDKRCYRLVGDTLVEYQVKDVIPMLDTNIKNLEGLETKLNEQLVAKGKEVNEYKEKNHIRFVNEKEFYEIRRNATNTDASTANSATK